MQKLIRLIVFSIAFLQFAHVNAQNSVELQWYGQSAFKITTQSGKAIMVDPWILKNPVTPPELKNLEKIGHHN